MDHWYNDSTRDGNRTAPALSFDNGSELDTPSLSSMVPVWSKICLIVFMTVALLLGVPGNSLVMAILLKLQKKTSTDWFVIFIALLDIISLLFSSPAQIIIILPDLWTVVSSSALCQFHAFTVNFVFLQSSFLIACVGIDRYFKTCKPYNIIFTAQLALRCSLILALFSALFNVSNLFITKLNAQGDCTLDQSKSTLSLVTYGILLTFVFGSCVVMCILYSKIAIQIRRRVKISPLSYTETFKRGDIVRRAGHFTKDRKANNTGIPFENVKQEASPVPEPITQRINVPGCSRSINRVKQTNLDEKQNMSNLVKQFQRTQNQMSRKSKQVNKTTKIMAAITLVFIVSATIPVIAVAVLTANGPEKFTDFGRVVIFLMMRLYFINNFVNPIFYIWLSSAFRKNVVCTIAACKRKIIT